MKSRWILILLLISALSVIPAAGCQSQPKYKAIELVPEQVNLIASIQVSKIVNDPDIRDAYDKFEKEADQPQTAAEALEKLAGEAGIDISNFSQALVFGDTETLESADYMGFIAEGAFDEGRFINNIEEKTGEEFSTSDYKGQKLYTGEDDDFSITFLNDSLLLGGSTRLVEDVIDVSQGDARPVSGQLLDTFNRYGETLISLSFEVPPETQDTLSEQPLMDDMPVSMDAFKDIDTIGFALDKENETLSVRIELHSPNTDSLQNMSDTITGLIIMFKGMIPEPGLKEFLGKVEVSVAEPWMTITFGIELPEIGDLVETFEHLSGD
jgi:hypothetical protein